MKRVAILMTVVLMMFAVVACAEPEAMAPEPVTITTAPAFALVNAVDGATVAMKPDDGNLKVVVFTCNECPYAKAFEARIIEVANKFGRQGVKFYAIDPNDDVKYPGESLAAMKERAADKEYPFPYLKDGDSSIAKAYGARVTPHVFVVDGQGQVRYRGYVDDSAKPGERENTALTDALGALVNGRDPATTETKAFGCGIKWKKS